MIGVGVSCTALALRNRGWSPRDLLQGATPGLWLKASGAGAAAQDVAGSVPALLPGTAIARLSDQSGNGYHATQATAISRPTLARWPRGGRRNLFTRTAALDHADWVKQQCTVAGTLIASNAAGSFPQIRQQPVPVQPGQVVTCSVDAWPEPGNANRSLTIIMSAAPSARITCNLDTGVVTAANGAAGGASLLPSGRWRVWWQYTIPAGMASIQVHYYVGTFAAQPAGVAVNLADPQIEIGAVQTAYQTVFSSAEISEPGRPGIWLIAADGIDDSLTVTLPAGSWTRARVNAAGLVTIEEGISPGSPENVLRETALAEILYVGRVLSTAEKARLTSHWTGAFA